jgi:hypothetical protein
MQHSGSNSDTAEDYKDSKEDFKDIKESNMVPHIGSNTPHERRMPQVPTLLRVTDLETHVAIFECLVEEEGISLDSMKAKVAFAKSVDSFPKIQEMIYNLIRLPFAQIRDNLVGCFASATHVRDELNSRIRLLTFHRDTIGNDIRGLYQFYLRANSVSPVPESTFVTEAFSVLPGAYKADLIRSAHSRFPNQLWQTISTYELCDLLDEVCFLRNQIEVSIPAKKAPKVDSVRRVQAPSAPAPKATSAHVSAASAKPRTPWMTKLMDKYIVYYINSFTREEILRVLQSANEHVQLRNKEGGYYYVVCFSSQKVAEEALDGLAPGSYRPASMSKN